MFIRIMDSVAGSDEVFEIPIEEDGCLLLSTLTSVFPNASGLKYMPDDSSCWRVVRVVDNKMMPSQSEWDVNATYHVVYPKASDSAGESASASDTKRKVDDDDGKNDLDSKLRKVDECYTTAFSNNSTSPFPCDLIVLGISFKTDEETLRKYFENFGELVLCELKRDQTGSSRGFGFIRFKKYESQVEALKSTHHIIDGRSCQAKIPDSKMPHASKMNVAMRKVFVARLAHDTTSEDLRGYFQQFGDVIDVYMSQPFRSFAFVTFRDADCIPNLFTQQHKLNGSYIHIGYAEPRASDRRFQNNFDDWGGHHRSSQSNPTVRINGRNDRFDRGPSLYSEQRGPKRSYMDMDRRSPMTNSHQQHPYLDQQQLATSIPPHAAAVVQPTNIDLTSMASMLTPAMMAAFLNVAASQQFTGTQQQEPPSDQDNPWLRAANWQQNLAAARSAAAAASSTNVLGSTWPMPSVAAHPQQQQQPPPNDTTYPKYGSTR